MLWRARLKRKANLSTKAEQSCPTNMENDQLHHVRLRAERSGQGRGASTRLPPQIAVVVPLNNRE